MANGSPTQQWPSSAAAEDPRAAVEGSLRCRLDDTGVLAVAGGDAATFLNGQFSTDITALGVGDAGITSYSDARGRVLAVPRLFVEPERLLLVLPAERLDPIRDQLAKYVLRADVRLEDRSAAHGCLGIAGQRAAAALTGLVDKLPTAPWTATGLHAGGGLIRVPGTGPRWVACGPSESLEPIWGALDGHAMDADTDAWRRLDIEAGVPSVHAATAGHFVAQMLNLDRLGAVDFRKGCYPGQEVIARTHYLGRIKRRMHVLRSHGGAVPLPGTPVVAAGETGGEVVDAAPHPDGGSLALAVLRLEIATSSLTLGDPDGPPVTAAAPPYGLDGDG